jgi:hypothetical protein
MKERGGPAGVILKNGYIVAMGDIHRVDMTFSVKKFSFYNSRLAIDNGLIKV